MNTGTRTRQLIARGASSNTSRRSVSRSNLTETITATDISFTNPSTIASAGSGFGAISVGSVIRVIGSPLNSREYLVGAAAADSLTVSPALIQDEVAGATIQIVEA